MFQQSVFVLMLLVTTAKAVYTVDVKTSSGIVTGVRRATTLHGKMYCAFYGIPYAERPVGGFRFQNPHAPAKWNGSRDCTSEYHGACAQSHVGHARAHYGTEDCLYINVYTPELPKHPDDAAPVLVWYHGHGWMASFSHIYGPDLMMENGVVMVSVSYRIGAFGFLKANASDDNANMGLKDILRSLMWIQRNIAQFGGDKGKVTVMGNSSAATLLALLSLTTKGKKYFSKMILHSGGIFSAAMYHKMPAAETLALREQLEKTGAKFVAAAKTEDIIQAAQKIYSSKDVINTQRPRVAFTPALEGASPTALLKQTPDKFYKVKKHLNIKIPVLIGSNTQEGLSEAIEIVNNPKILRTLNSFFKYIVPFSDGCRYEYTSKAYLDISSKIKAFYFNNDVNENSIGKFLKYLTDLHRYPIYRFIKALMPNGAPLYVYKFNYNGILNAYKANLIEHTKTKIRGAAGGDELCYIFNCEPYWETYLRLKNETDNRHRLFMVSLAKMWANFVKFGNPTPSDQAWNVTWLPITPTQNNILFIGKRTEMIKPQVEDKMFAFWNQLYSDYYSENHCAKDEL